MSIPDHLSHGTAYVHGKLKCRCGPCQEWRREHDRNRPPRGKNKPRKPVEHWYVCANQWGMTFAEHEYSRTGLCIRCGADKTTELFWEQRWETQ